MKCNSVMVTGYHCYILDTQKSLWLPLTSISREQRTTSSYNYRWHKTRSRLKIPSAVYCTTCKDARGAKSVCLHVSQSHDSLAQSAWLECSHMNVSLKQFIIFVWYVFQEMLRSTSIHTSRNKLTVCVHTDQPLLMTLLYLHVIWVFFQSSFLS